LKDINTNTPILAMLRITILSGSQRPRDKILSPKVVLKSQKVEKHCFRVFRFAYFCTMHMIVIYYLWPIISKVGACRQC